MLSRGLGAPHPLCVPLRKELRPWSWRKWLQIPESPLLTVVSMSALCLPGLISGLETATHSRAVTETE